LPSAEKRNWAEKAEHFWHALPGTEDLNALETAEIYGTFTGFLRDVNGGYRPQQSSEWWELLSYMGWSEETFDWEAFGEWYDE
jgi:hypothetical protein